MGPIYQPEDIDEDAYGPPKDEAPLPPKPKWTPAPGPEREAFITWSLAMLDRMYEEHDLEHCIRELQADYEGHRVLREIINQPLFDAARKLMPHLTSTAFARYRYGAADKKASKPKKVGRKGAAKVAAARIDNARLTIIWRKHFDGQDRRDVAPSRLDILQRRHGLTDSERDTLENYLSKLK